MRSKTLLVGVGVVIGLLLAAAGIVVAGSLNPSAGPTDPGSQMYTLEQIYTRLTGGGDATKMATFTEPSSGPGSTMHTLDELYALALPASVPKTGQITSYTTGDDGALQKGVAWPNPRFTDHSNGTVTDNLTGLIWLKNANCANATRDWATALTDVASLNSGGTMNTNNCGDTSNSGSHQTDWRLPNVREIQSLVHYGFLNPAVPNTVGTGQWTEGNPFTGVQSDVYWSSTTYAIAGNPVYAWDVFLWGGQVGLDEKPYTHYVWPVRGGQ